ncbi:hypothetical protein CYG49_01410, partial [Candidatus Saccharibacteria bacterium]
DIGDVDVATPSDGQSLVFQAGVWIPATITSSGGVTDHGALTGLGADHHLHYHNDARGDARYYLKADVDTKINGRIDAAEKAAPNGVASLDANGKVPSSQLPPTTSISDATTTSKGILQLAGDLSGTADAPTVPGLAGKVNATEKGAANGVATLGADGKVPAEQLPASSGGGTFTASVKTAAYTCVNYDFLLCNASTSGFTITLPPVGNGVWVRVKKTDSTTNAVIVVGQNNTTINGDASYVLNIQNASQDFMGDGTNWHLI